MSGELSSVGFALVGTHIGLYLNHFSQFCTLV